MAEQKTSEGAVSGDKSASSGQQFKGDHDRVAIVSRHPDGSPNQINPEMIGDKDAALEATKEQLTQQAVSAADTEKRAEQAAQDQPEQKQDKSVEELQKVHEDAKKSAEKAAEAEVNALHGDKS